jgi:hypothetical protein
VVDAGEGRNDDSFDGQWDTGHGCEFTSYTVW